MSKKSKLENICDLIDEKIVLNEIIKHNLIKMNYISTENMLPDKNGIIPSKSIPSIGKGGKYKRNDTLLSNIRPYFKKIWLAKDEGACSNDVLIFRAKENYHHDFLYYNLANDAFFEYAMKTSKGTKMPRGDKTAIKKYDIYDFDYITQQKLTKTLRLLDDEIELKRQINANLPLLFLLLFVLVQLFFSR
ncbi:restriction endonuclease subunit S [Treponema vincentii]|uniref:restriction endonuclease subunit S n=1 Tax=Treponema vincentii TaxID=69710 RepID=UPI0020A59E27|nr:restriction endonuclease subunit S [Treponema vincentii]UTC45194.1 restriction endonuclease subunit S [Treponema vincentii]UTC47500.1 restriction endonuclease subunit S [Treponema vincentii]UTC60133.1 restriction endonuclease subunit S [Treponema vincentii]